MYKYDIRIKNGTGGHYDSDDCDKHVATLETDFLPRIGETILLTEKDTPSRYVHYLIRDISYWYLDKHANGICMYVVPV